MKLGNKLCKLSNQIGKKDIGQWGLAVDIEQLKTGYEDQHNAKYVEEADKVLKQLHKSNMDGLKTYYVEQDGLDGVLDEIGKLMFEEKELREKEIKNPDEARSLKILQKRLRAYGLVVHEDACKLGISTRSHPRESLTREQRFAAHEMHSTIQKHLGERLIWHEHDC